MAQQMSFADEFNALLIEVKHLTITGLQSSFSPSEYERVETIGVGNFGRVYLYKNSKGKRIAVKRIKSKTDPKENARNQYLVSRELKVIGKLKHHKNVLDFYYHKIIDDRIHIFMELCGGNLKEFLSERTLNLKSKIDILSQVADGMTFIHAERIIHKDLKPDNILIKDFGAEEALIKITDFGLAHPLDHDDHTTTLSLSFGGTRPYMAPELVQTQLSGEQTHKKNYKVDVWSLGVVSYKVLKGDYPFKYPNITMNFTAAEEIPKDFKEFNNEEFTALLVKIFDQDPKERPSMKEVHQSLCKITLE